ncbi:E3 ubiquitin-protein ligase tom1, partial [Linderina pennispora]
IPAHALRAIVNVLAAGECTSRTFQHTLSLIQNLSHMPGVLSEIISELITRASLLSSSVCEDIGQLLPLLQSLAPPDDSDEHENDSTSNTPARTRTPTDVTAELLDKVRDTTLAKFSPASSHQSRLLRLLMALDYISTTLSKRLEGSSEKEAKPAEAAGSKAMDVDSKLARSKQWALIRGPSFQPLWAATSECLKCTASSTDLAHVATVLLPLIESFMVVFKPI